MDNGFDFSQIMHESVIRQLPTRISMPIKDSEFFFTGTLNYKLMNIENARITTKARTSKTFSHISNKWKRLIPRNLSFTVITNGQPTPWKFDLFDLDPDTFEIGNLVCQRGGIFSIIMADATTEPDVDFDIAISTGLGYAFPARFDTSSTLRKYQGRVPRVLEELGHGNYAGEIFFEVQFKQGQWLAWMQQETKVDHEDRLVQAARMVRRSIKSSDERALVLKRGLLHQSTGKVALYPGYICANSGNRGLIETHAIELLEDQEPGDTSKQWSIPLSDFFKSADGPGLAAAFPWLVWRIMKYASVLTPNPTPANVPIDPSITTGFDIVIGVVRRRDGSIAIIPRSGQMHNREGMVVSCVMESGFDPSSINASPIMHVHGTIDLNTKRKGSTSTIAGLHRVVVHEYQEDQLPHDLTLETIDDVKQNGDGPAWMVLSMHIWHLYGQQVQTLSIDDLTRLLPEAKN